MVLARFDGLLGNVYKRIYSDIKHYFQTACLRK